MFNAFNLYHQRLAITQETSDALDVYLYYGVLKRIITIYKWRLRYQNIDSLSENIILIYS